MQKAYRKYESAAEEAYCCNQSSLVCQEEKKEAVELANSAFAEFKCLIFERLETNEPSSSIQTKIIRETPIDGYKDFNDELLGKIENSQKESLGKENNVNHNGFKR